MKIPFWKMFSMVVLSVLLLVACTQPGTNSAVDQNSALNESAANGGGLKGLDSSQLIGKWEALDVNNALDAKDLTITQDSTSEEPVQSVPAEDSSSIGDGPMDVAQTSTSQIKSVKPTTCLNYPRWCPTLCKQWAYAEGCQAYLKKHSCLHYPIQCPTTCKIQPSSEGCQTYLNKPKQPSGGSSQPVQTGIAPQEPIQTAYLKMLIGSTKPVDVTENDLGAYIVDVDATNNMIQIQLGAPLYREDYYLIREVGGVTYFDICPCESKECTPDNTKTCSSEFLKQIEAGKPGQFKKL